MLCFTDGALAHLVIAATAIPAEERGGWLKALGQALDPPPPISPALCKRRASRRANYHRLKAGRMVFQIEVDLDRAVRALQRSGIVAEDRLQIRKALQAMVDRWIEIKLDRSS